MSTIKSSTTTTTAYQVVADTTGTLVIQTGSTPTTAVTVDASQNVGIGTSSPSEKVEIVGNLKLNNGAADGAQLVLSSSGYSAWNWDNYSGRLRAYYGSTEYFTIDASGNVGIGTASPTSKLSVANGSSGGFEVNPDGTGGGPALIGYNRNTSAYLQMTSNALFHVWQTSGTERMRIDSSGNLLVGTTTQATGALLTVNGSIQGVITSGTAVASTSGTSITFTGIPSWAKRITVMFNGVSTNGSSNVIIQIGSGSVTTTGYLGSATVLTTVAASSNFTTGFGVALSNAAASVFGGVCSIATLGSNIWAMNGSLGFSNAAGTIVSGAYVTLGGTLDRVRITTVNGTDTFDAGSINIQYEG